RGRTDVHEAARLRAAARRGGREGAPGHREDSSRRSVSAQEAGAHDVEPTARGRALPTMAPLRRVRPPARSRWAHADRMFEISLLGFALSVIAVTAIVAGVLWRSSAEARGRFGWSFLWTSDWNPVELAFGALPFVFGTIATSAI